MIRLNVMIDEALYRDLSKIKNKSEFIRNAVREKLEQIKQRELSTQMEEGYRKEGMNLREWETTVNDGWD